MQPRWRPGEIRTAAEIITSLEAWAGDPAQGKYRPPTEAARTANTAVQRMAAPEAWMEDKPFCLTSAVLVDSSGVARTATEMMASSEAWTGDPPFFIPQLFPKKNGVAAKTAAQMMTSLEAWTGDPPLVRTCAEFSVMMVAWDDDPLVRNATDFAASLEAWLGYPRITGHMFERNPRTDKEKEKKKCFLRLWHCQGRTQS